ncbi:MAG TPA: glycosyltransferase [Solirubrobacteraceae bacterium]|nr:glycosyltransferase [Solirubrobacteraceae bacterium]
MRVLIVSVVPPAAEGGAAARCLLGLLRGLRAHGVQASVLCPGAEAERGRGVPADIDIEFVPLELEPGWRMRWRRLRMPHGELTREPFATHLRSRAREADVVHFLEIEPASAIGLVDRPALVQLHCLANLDPRVWNPLRTEGRTSIELLMAERRVRRRARWLLVNSADVAGHLRSAAPNSEVVLAPLSLDSGSYTPSATLDSSAAGLIGSAAWPPTANAVERLLREVWPLVLQRSPDARLVLAGFGMEQVRFSHLPQLRGVEWRGAVDSASDFLRELGLLLYPLTAGSGAKVKVLEALAIGLPVVTTARGAEGIVGDGGITVAGDDDALVKAAVRLIGSPHERRAAGSAALRSFEEHHTPGPAAVPVVNLYEQMLA